MSTAMTTHNGLAHQTASTCSKLWFKDTQPARPSRSQADCSSASRVTPSPSALPVNSRDHKYTLKLDLAASRTGQHGTHRSRGTEGARASLAHAARPPWERSTCSRRLDARSPARPCRVQHPLVDGSHNRGSVTASLASAQQQRRRGRGNACWAGKLSLKGICCVMVGKRRTCSRRLGAR
jgi:hypothetical protein